MACEPCTFLFDTHVNKVMQPISVHHNAYNTVIIRVLTVSLTNAICNLLIVCALIEANHRQK